MEVVLISEFGLYDMQTFLKVFQTGSIPRHTPDQVRYHYIVKTSYKLHHLFNAFFNSATLQSSFNMLVLVSFFGEHKLFSFLVL